MNESSKPPRKAIQVDVRKKRAFLKREPPAPEPEQPRGASARPAAKRYTASMDPPPNPAAGAQSTAEPGDKTAPYKSLQSVPWEPVPAQAIDLLNKTDVVLLVAPAGACSFSLTAYFVAFLSGKQFAPFGGARYPGDVIYITYTPGLDRAMRAAVSSCYPSDKEVFIPKRRAKFDWEKPGVLVEQALSNRKPGSVAAIVIDTGANPPRSAAIAEQAYAELLERAEQEGFLILLVTNTNSKRPDPYDRVPRSLQSFRGTLLAAPLLPKAPVSRFGTMNEFLLMRLVDVAPNAAMVRFMLTPAFDRVERSLIHWGQIYYDNPRAAFQRAEADDVPPKMLEAIQVAIAVIQARGPTTTEELRAAGVAQPTPVARSTMRDALHQASLHNYLRNERNYAGQHYWIIPGVTPFSPSFGLPDPQIPF